MNHSYHAYGWAHTSPCKKARKDLLVVNKGERYDKSSRESKISPILEDEIF